MINGELIVDNFAGGGGASTGIELATGKSVDIPSTMIPKPSACIKRIIRTRNITVKMCGRWIQLKHVKVIR